MFSFLLYFVGLVMFSVAAGSATNTATGFMILGGGLILSAMVTYLNGPKK